MALAVLGLLSYISASAFFWHYPHFIHRKKKVRFHARHISHRGGSAEGYENTLNNFKRAVSSGTEMLELDVRLTMDKKVVVFHDSDMRRLMGLENSVSDCKFDQLPLLKLSVPIDTIPGKQFSDPTLRSDERRVPLLSQVFEAFPTLPINVDLKDNDSEELIIKVAELIRAYDRQHLTVWGSFNHKDCMRLYEEDPSVGLFFSGKRVMLLLLMMVIGMLPFIPLRETHYEVFLPLSIKRRRLAEVESLALHEKFIFWFCDKFLVWKPLISHLRKRGIQVYFWVANEDDEFEQCLHLGADGVMTDYPAKLRKFLDKYYATESEPNDSSGQSSTDEAKSLPLNQFTRP